MSRVTDTTHIVYYTSCKGSASAPRMYLKVGSSMGYCSLASLGKTDDKKRYMRIDLDSVQTRLDHFPVRSTRFAMLHESKRYEVRRNKSVKWVFRGKDKVYGDYFHEHSEITQDFLYASKLIMSTAHLSEKEPSDEPPAYEETNSHTPEETVIKCTYRREPDYSLSSTEISGDVKTYRFTVIRRRIIRNRYFAFEIRCPAKCQIQVVHSEVKYISHILEAHKRKLQVLLLRSVGDDRWLLPVTVIFDTNDKSVKVRQGECRFLGRKTGTTGDADLPKPTSKTTTTQTTSSWNVPQVYSPGYHVLTHKGHLIARL